MRFEHHPRVAGVGAAALTAIVLAALPVAALATSHAAPAFVTGGVSIEQAGALQQQRDRFSLWLVTAAQSGAYLAGAEAIIRNADGDLLLQTGLDGPYLMVDLAPGWHTVEVNYNGQVQQQRVLITDGTTRELLLRFDSPAQLSPDLRR